MGQKPGYPPVNIPISTKTKPKTRGAPTPKWDPIASDNHSQMEVKGIPPKAPVSFPPLKKRKKKKLRFLPSENHPGTRRPSRSALRLGREAAQGIAAVVGEAAGDLGGQWNRIFESEAKSGV